ncbi:WS/DGAT/MGAT family O-acyltransferase [Skermania piniformis]|uniref:Diacylglycerol O-acyltransferase n=1 Tax=Skermania pinensis TaxID=39122 RepID=A0ABX8S8G2_9ACTN|nr:wax ester/triacylglycerol synthase family O-acyltransferase [Skermania piniformis]QXQ13736.1 wax ester/triacylglycerol synthase family O-acyltransferase [Skermania piniformis]
MRVMSPLDGFFLFAESREHPMHVGGLMLFEPPAGAGPDHAREIYEQLLKQTEVRTLFRTRPARPVNSVGHLGWSVDDSLDFEYHVRLSALPRPGRVRELLELVSRMHGTLLDRHRPLWELHVIEGLADGRVAVYSKIHHSLVDGVSALRLVQQSLSPDPADTDCSAYWTPRRTPIDRPGPGIRESVQSGLAAGVGALRGVAGLAPAAGRFARAAFRAPDVTLPLTAPRTMLNVDIGGARRFAAQSWSIDRVRTLKAATGTTVNDIVVAMCAGALRRYLLDQNALPETSLTAALPVSLRELVDDGREPGGNAIGLMMCRLGTDRADPIDRLGDITRSIGQSKMLLRDAGTLPALAGMAAIGAPLALELVPGYQHLANPPFNVLISNVPGPREELYFNGARLVGAYPLSLVADGQALNITVTSRAGYLDFGLTGCRRSVPSLQRLLTHLDTSLVELETAIGVD